MSDDPNERGAGDRRHISLSQDQEVRYRFAALRVSEDTSREVVGRVGNSADAVRRHLEGR